MSHTLTLELNDEIYTAIRRHAEDAGISPVDWAIRVLKGAPRLARETALNERERQNAQDLAELNAAYADAPAPEEQETQRRMWELQKRQMAREPW